MIVVLILESKLNLVLGFIAILNKHLYTQLGMILHAYSCEEGYCARNRTNTYVIFLVPSTPVVDGKYRFVKIRQQCRDNIRDQVQT